MGEDWKFPLCSCCDTPAICLWAWCIPGGSLCMQVMAVSNVSEMPDAGLVACFVACRYGIYGQARNRYTIREQLGIKGNIIEDCCTFLFCGVCASVQEYRHVMAEKHGDDKRGPWRAK